VLIVWLALVIVVFGAMTVAPLLKGDGDDA